MASLSLMGVALSPGRFVSKITLGRQLFLPSVLLEKNRPGNEAKGRVDKWNPPDMRMRSFMIKTFDPDYPPPLDCCCSAISVNGK